VDTLHDELIALATEHDVLLPLFGLLDLPISGELLYDIAPKTVSAPDAYNQKIIVYPTERFRVLCAALRTGDVNGFLEIVARYSHSCSLHEDELSA
jgi:hypothetical protein